MKAYFIESNVLLALFYFIYLLFIRRETNFLWNRIYLLLTLCVAIILPTLPKLFLGSTSNEIINLIDGVTLVNRVPTIDPEQNTDLINPLMIIYLAGVTWFGLRFLSSMGRLLSLYQRFPKTRVSGLKTVVLPGDHAPFTFFNILFISEHELGSDKDEGIIKHEQTHINQLHSLDILLVEFCSILLWFNPVIWLLKTSLKAEHEYAADEQVVKEGYNQLSYQQLLVGRTMGVNAISLANNFNHSLLKNRITMMIKDRPGSNSGIKYYLSLPLILVVVACSLVEVDKATHTDDQVYDQVEVMPEYPGGIKEVRTYIMQQVRYPDIAKEMGVSGKIFVQFTVDKDGSVTDPIIMRSDINSQVEDEIVVVGYKTADEKNASPVKEGILALETEALRVVGTIPDFTPGMQDGKPVKVRYTFPIVFALQ